MPFTAAKPEEIEAHLANNPYLTEGGLPGAEDAKVYFELNGVAPSQEKTPNFYHWYYFVNSWSNDLLQSWIDKANPKAAEKKPAADDDDLFGDDDESAPKPKAAPKVAPKKKEKPAAKSIVMFEVKVYDQETNLDELAKKIISREIPGLVWNNEPKKVDVAYGMQKLQMGCVIEDDKVLTDDIFDPIEEYPEVQSVDMTSMQKLWFMYDQISP